MCNTPVEIQKTYWTISSTSILEACMPPTTLEHSNVTLTGKLEVRLPVFFTNSINPQKFIEVRHCKVIYKDALVNDVKLHSDIIKEHPFDDHFICFTNEVLVKPRKYKWNSSEKTLRIWFSDIRNNPIELTDFHIDILLMY
jgi:hypothetical protein